MRAKVTKNYFRRSFFVGIFATLLVLGLTAVVLASGGGEEGAEGPNWMNLTWRMLNFIALVWFLWWFLASKVKDFFGGRREDIKKSLEEARAAKEEAEAKFKE
ncbi:MAG: hypothetical protein PHY31_08120, partial [Smithellaceae bacterium]|nr:hypothetical protein [Smithellaceae bacterium]